MSVCHCLAYSVCVFIQIEYARLIQVAILQEYAVQLEYARLMQVADTHDSMTRPGKKIVEQRAITGPTSSHGCVMLGLDKLIQAHK